MDHYKYIILTDIDGSALEYEINEYAEKGWRLVKFDVAEHDYTAVMELIRD